MPAFRYIILLPFICLSLLNTHSALSQVFFNKILPPPGTTLEHVTGITQDANGYMWFATISGLYSFDGYHFTSYVNNLLNPNSLASSRLESIYADHDGIIWVGTFGAGLDRFDPATGIFTHFRHEPNNLASLSNDSVTAILRDKQGNLWIGTHGGLNRLDLKTNNFIHYRDNANDPGSLSNNQVRAIYEDRQQTLWIGTGSPYAHDGGGPQEGGLNRLNKSTGKFIRYLHDPNDIHSLVNNKVRAIFEDNKGVFWIGTARNGLHKMNRQQGTFERIVNDPAHPEKLSPPSLTKESPLYSHITFITQDATGSYWIGTSEDGINYYNPEKGRTIHYRLGKDTAGAFTDRSAWWAYKSREGAVWLGTWNGNLYRISPLQKTVPSYHNSYSGFSSFYEETNGNVWTSTHGGGLILNDTGNRIIKQILNDPNNPASLSHNDVDVIKEDNQGKIWVGTHEGLNLWDKKNGTFTRYRHDPQNSNSLIHDHVLNIYVDRRADLWLCTFGGLTRMTPKTGKFTRYLFYPNDTSSFGLNTVSSVLEDRRGKWWASCLQRGGVIQFNPENDKSKTYLKGSTMAAMFEDADGSLWAGGNEGLFQYNHISDSFYRFIDPVSGNGYNNVQSIREDNLYNLWMGTSDGIVKMNRQRNEINVYGRSSGIAEQQFSWGACYIGRKGKLFFGHANGYYAFFPGQLTTGVRPPEIFISGFRLANRLVLPDKNGPLPEPLSQTKKLNLKYNQNVFSFDFAVIDYTNPENNRHIFMLENYDNDWRQSGSEHRAYYFNVPPGKYTFRVKGANSNGVWAQKAIELIISPPWWLTWWAYTLYGLLLLAVVYTVHRYQRQRLIRSERERARAKELEQAKEIEKAYTELKSTQAQLIQSEKMASLGELTAGIAHEIQNPLNFVNNFSEVNKEMLAELNEEINKGNYDNAKAIAKDVIGNEQKINHHGKRADAIVKGMLQHSRASTGKKEPTNINALCNEYLRLSYHGLRAKDKSFTATMKTDFDNSIGNINIIPQDIGRVVLNLINNAFYAVSEKAKLQADNYEPTVSVSTKGLNNTVEIRVRDNGSGIPKDIADKIFQPFFTTKPTGQGTGLGLSLSYDIIKAHGGEIKVETKEGEFTSFLILLPA